MADNERKTSILIALVCLGILAGSAVAQGELAILPALGTEDV